MAKGRFSYNHFYKKLSSSVLAIPGRGGSNILASERST